MGKGKKKVEEEEEEETYSVEKLVDFKEDKKKGKLFLVKWKGYSASENTWEPAENLVDECQDMMDELEEKKAKAAGKGKAAEEPKKAPPKKKPTPTRTLNNTRFMTTKPKREGAGKREILPPPQPPPVKKQKTEKENDKPEVDLKKIADALMASVLGIESKEEKGSDKPASAKRKRSGEKETTIVEVDSIIGMRARKNGVQYKIKWGDGTQTWEPYDNVMDDDLIDEFEEARQIEVYGDDTLAAGDEVEVKNMDDGFENSWSAAVVKKKEKGNKFTVEYSSFVDEDDEPMSESGLERKRLRLAPPAADKAWVPVVGEIVEVNEDDCWWEAFVEELMAKNKVSLKYRASDEIKTATLGKKVRPCSWLKMDK